MNRHHPMREAVILLRVIFRRAIACIVGDKSMRVLLVGVNHQIQPAQIMSMSTNGSLEAFEQDQKERFGQLLRDYIRDRGVQFVGEEARYGQETIAQRVCQQERCRYANIDMTPQERESHNCPPGYNEDPGVPQAEKTRCNQEREEHMSGRVLAESGSAASVLVICGRLHAEAIAARLIQPGHSVEIVDLQNQNWYIEDWLDHMLHL